MSTNRYDNNWFDDRPYERRHEEFMKIVRDTFDAADAEFAGLEDGPQPPYPDEGGFSGLIGA